MNLDSGKSFLIGPDEKCLMVVDGVFGLPGEVWDHLFGAQSETQDLTDLFYLIMQRTQLYPGYGRKVAEDFFIDLLGRKYLTSPPLKREIEIAAKTNSLFTFRPFQKNVQTGTYRLWKDLSAANERWFSIWSMTKNLSKATFVLVEGFPTLAWRQELDLRTRDGELFFSALKKSTWFPHLKISSDAKALLRESPDHRDAFVLTLAGLRSIATGAILRKAPVKDPREGWILGY